jgi:hypothetical protein
MHVKNAYRRFIMKRNILLLICSLTIVLILCEVLLRCLVGIIPGLRYANTRFQSG